MGVKISQTRVKNGVFSSLNKVENGLYKAWNGQKRARISVFVPKHLFFGGNFVCETYTFGRNNSEWSQPKRKPHNFWYPASTQPTANTKSPIPSSELIAPPAQKGLGIWFVFEEMGGKHLSGGQMGALNPRSKRFWGVAALSCFSKRSLVWWWGGRWWWEWPITEPITPCQSPNRAPRTSKRFQEASSPTKPAGPRKR